MDILGLVEISNWLLIVIALLTGLYFYLTWNHKYFESQGIPGPKPLMLGIGNFFQMFTKGMAKMDSDNLKQCGGDKCGTYEGRTPVLLVQDPEFLKQVFIRESQNFMNRRVIKADEINNSMLSNAAGEQWKILRSTISPCFSTGKLKVMTRQMCECAQDFVDALDKEADSGKSVELKEYAGCFTMDVIASTAFGLKLNSQQDKDSNFIKMAKKVFDPNQMNPLFFLVLLFPPLMFLFKLLDISIFPKEVEKFFVDVIRQTMGARQESGQTRLDFMQLMMNAHKENDQQEDKGHDQDFKEKYKGVAKRSLTETEVLSQGFLFFLAGYDTTASSIAFLLYNLAINPEVQEELHEEIVSVAGNEEIDYNFLNKMNYLDMCVQESLRLYAPAVRTERQCNEDTTIQGIKIRKGVVVGVPIQYIHMNPRIWPEPEKFKPERFTPEEKAKHSSFDWLPFGAGPRNCVAMRLALTEVKLSVAYLVRKFKFVRSFETEVPLPVGNTFGIVQPKNGVWMQIERRT